MKNIVLMGFMGAGKTTIGKRLAKAMNCEFIDTDAKIEEEQGRKISDIFAEEGETAFRDMETDLLRRMQDYEGKFVLSIGGGMPVREENRQLLRNLGTVVYLKTSKEEIIRRVSGNKNRPLLQGGNLEEKVTGLMKAREEIYLETAHKILTTDSKSVSKLVNDICSFNKIRLIAMDIDGTLLNSDRVLTEKTKKVLLEAQNKGIQLILASGRPVKGMQDLARELEMDKHHGLMVCYNGSQIRDAQTNEVLYNRPLTLEHAKKVLEHVKKFQVYPMVDSGEYMLVNDVYDAVLHELNDRNIVEYEAREGSFLLKEMKDLAEIDFEPNKISTAGEPSYLKEHEEEMRKPFEETLSCMFTDPFYFEYTEKNIDKGTAIEKIYEIFHCSKENLIAFGDAPNDISMLKKAGIGVAMENAAEAVKEAADFVTLSNNEDGIVYALKKYGII